MKPYRTWIWIGLAFTVTALVSALSGCSMLSASKDLDLAEGMLLQQVATNQRASNQRTATQLSGLRTESLAGVASEGRRAIAAAADPAAEADKQFNAYVRAADRTYQDLANDKADLANSEGNCQLLDEVAATRLSLAERAQLLRAKGDALLGKTTVLMGGAAASQPAR